MELGWGEVVWGGGGGGKYGVVAPGVGGLP